MLPPVFKDSNSSRRLVTYRQYLENNFKCDNLTPQTYFYFFGTQFKTVYLIYYNVLTVDVCRTIVKIIITRHERINCSHLSRRRKTTLRKRKYDNIILVCILDLTCKSTVFFFYKPFKTKTKKKLYFNNPYERSACVLFQKSNFYTVQWRVWEVGDGWIVSTLNYFVGDDFIIGHYTHRYNILRSIIIFKSSPSFQFEKASGHFFFLSLFYLFFTRALLKTVQWVCFRD